MNMKLKIEKTIISIASFHQPFTDPIFILYNSKDIDYSYDNIDWNEENNELYINSNAIQVISQLTNISIEELSKKYMRTLSIVSSIEDRVERFNFHVFDTHKETIEYLKSILI